MAGRRPARSLIALATRQAWSVAAGVLVLASTLPAAAGVYVSNVDDSTVSVIDARNHGVIGTVGVGQEPRNLAANPAGTRVYVPNRFSDSVSVIDTASNTVIATVTHPSFFEPYAAAVTPDGGEVWVANKQGGGSETGSVTIIDTAINTVADTIDHTCLFSPEGIAINPVLSRAYVVSRNSTVCVFDTTTRALVTTVTVGSNPRFAVVTPDGARVYVSGSPVTRIDTTTHAATTITDVSGRNLAVTPAGDKVYVATQSNTVKAIAVATDAVTTIAFPGASSTYGVAVSDGRGFVTDESQDTVRVFDVATDTEITGDDLPIAVGSTPRAIAATPAGADLAVTIAGAPDPAGIGASVTYTIVVTNDGPLPADGATLTDVLPSGATLVSKATTRGTCAGTTTITCAFGSLGAGLSATATIVVRFTLGGAFSHTVTVASATPDPVAENNAATAMTTVEAGMLQFAAPTFSVSEGSATATITVRRTGSTAGTVMVSFVASDGTGIAGVDYRALAGTLTFTPGVATRTFSVAIIPNTRLDGDRSVNLTLTNPTNGATLGEPATAVLTIVDNDRPGVIRLSSATYSGPEGKSVVITIQRVPPVGGGPLGGNVSVSYATSSINGSATEGVDYVPRADVVTFVGTETTKRVTLSLLPDSLAEGRETFRVTLSDPTSGATLGTPSTALVTIVDVDKGGVVVLGQGKYTVAEGAGNVSITIKRSAGAAGNVSVLLTAAGGTAVDGADYTAIATTVTFDANDTTKTVVVPILQDLEGDGNTTFTVVLSSPQGGATLGTPSSALVTILDDDPAIQFAQAVFTTKEAAPGVIKVVRSGPLGSTATVRVDVSGVTAVAGVDFTPLPGGGGTLTFGPKQALATFQVSTLQNARLDGDRRVLLTLSNPTGGAALGAQSTAHLTLTDDEDAGVISLTGSSFSVPESGGRAVIGIVRTPSRPGTKLIGDVSVSYATVSGSAGEVTDYTPVAGTVVFGPGDLGPKRIAVPITPDTLAEPNETFDFALSSPLGGAVLGTPAAATITIVDDDRGGVVVLSQADYSIKEGAGSLSIMVLRTGGSANASVHFATVPGTAADGGDYGGVSATLTFGAGQMSRTVVIPIVQDEQAEGEEVFTVMLSNPTGGLTLGTPSSAPVTIIDDELVIEFSNRFVKNQPEVVRTGSLLGNVSVQYVATSGTAVLGEDFVLTPGTLVFPPGVSSRTVPIEALADDIAEGPETFAITLFNPTPPARLGANFSRVFVLDDRDFGGTVNFGNTSPTATLGETNGMTIVRSPDGLGTEMVVGWAAIGGTASGDGDFFPASGTVTFAANESVRTFFVGVPRVASVFGKTVVLGLTVPGGGAASLGPANVSTLTILGPPFVRFDTATYTVNETDGSRLVTIVREADLGPAVTVDYATTDGSATAGADYTATSGTATFAPGQTTATFSVPILTDTTGEGPETITLVLSNPTGGAVLGPPSTSVITIADVAPAEVQFESATYAGAEGTDVTITVVRSGGEGPVTAMWSVVGGNASPDTDFSPTSGLLTLPSAGSSQTFTISLATDVVLEGPESIVLGLGIVSGLGVVGPTATAAVTIDNTTRPTVVQFASAAYSVNEDEGVATIKVKRTGNLGIVTTVDYATSDGSAFGGADYTPASGTLTFPATTGYYQHLSFTVPIVNDGLPEGPKTVNLTLGNVSATSVLGSNATAVLTINDPVAVDYTFTVLYSGVATVGLPSLNDTSQFGFDIVNGVTDAIYAGSLETPADLRLKATLPDSTVQASQGTRFPVDSGETVAFRAILSGPGSGVVLASNGSTPSILFQTGPTVSFVGEPSMSTNGTIAFKASLLGAGVLDAVLVGNRTGVATAVSAGAVTDVGVIGDIGPVVAVNDSGTVAFTALTSSGVRGLFLSNGSAITTLASTQVDFSDIGANVWINSGNEVAFVATELDGNTSVYRVSSSGVRIKVVSTGGPAGFTAFGTEDASPVIGNDGTVAFLAFYPGGSGIFTGLDRIADKVVATGDVIDGRTVTDLAVGGINAGGRISFLAVLSDEVISEVAAVVATPSVP